MNKKKYKFDPKSSYSYKIRSGYKVAISYKDGISYDTFHFPIKAMAESCYDYYLSKKKELKVKEIKIFDLIWRELKLKNKGA